MWNATARPTALRAPHFFFQYPRTDRVECYIHISDGIADGIHFQYPRTDRVECYLVGEVGTPLAGVYLSVSSDGSCGMLPATATMARPIQARLSVSSDGSCGMLPILALMLGCGLRLSVSSDGSCGMLHKTGTYVVMGLVTFSILGRIVWNATQSQGKPLPVKATFSILGRIVWNATINQEVERWATCFPFSILGRIVWNATVLRASIADAASTFSILGRIVWNATFDPWLASPATGCFQYPRTDRVECYTGSPAPKVSIGNLSVSSDGSCGMLLSWSLVSAGCIVLSVSSDGSCGMLLDLCH